MPQHLRPQVLASQLPGKQLLEVPVGDVLLRRDAVAQSPDPSAGCRSFWPHLKPHVTYCSFRNPRLSPSVHGGDSVCSVETAGGRRKVGPKELLDTQRVMRMDIVAAPGEEVPTDVPGARRLHRAIGRASDWLKEILEAKGQDAELGFDWHVLACIQGGGDVKIRQKACTAAAAMPVAGYWIGGLGYQESLGCRAKVLEAVTSALSPSLPRFLPLNVGTPIEVLQAVLLGVDVLEVAYPAQAAAEGVALLFGCEMPEEETEHAQDDAEVALGDLLPQAEGAAPPAPARVVRQLHLRAPECREDFGPISAASPAAQYSRAYLHHLFEVRELLGTMLLAQHNLHAYECLFAAMRSHIERGTIRLFASWFLRTQTLEAPHADPSGPTPKRRKT